jgi:hypothetical protein
MRVDLDWSNRLGYDECFYLCAVLDPPSVICILPRYKYEEGLCFDNGLLSAIIPWQGVSYEKNHIAELPCTFA